MEQRPERTSVIVVGAGIVGLSIALRLQMDGFKVTVVDKNTPMRGVSCGNAGYLSEANIFPPATPDLVRQLPKLVLDKDGPLVVKPSYVPTLLPWAWRAVSALKPEPYRQVLGSLSKLTAGAIASFEEFAKEARAQHLISREGGLMVFRSRAALEAKCRSLPVWNSQGLAAERVSADQVSDMEPALTKSILGGIYFPNAGRCSNPRGLGELYAKRLQEAGAEFVTAEVHDVLTVASGNACVATAAGNFIAESVVLAAGFATKPLLERFGYKVPLASERGYHLMLPGSGVALRRPVVFGEPFFAATPMDEGLRLAGTAEFAHPDAKPNMARADMLLALAKPYLPGIDGRDAQPWMGVRPSFPDGMPAIGQVSGASNIFYAFGHSHIGLTTSAITARCVVSLIKGLPAPVDLTPFRLGRFG